MSFKNGDIIVATEDIVGLATGRVLIPKGRACFVCLDSAGCLRYKPVAGVWPLSGNKSVNGNRLSGRVMLKFKKV